MRLVCRMGIFLSPVGSSPFREARSLPLPHRLTRNVLLAETRCHKAEDLCRSQASSLCTSQPEPLSVYAVTPIILRGPFRCLCHLYPHTGSLPRIWTQRNRQKTPFSSYHSDGSRAPVASLAANRAVSCHFHAYINTCTVSISFRPVLFISYPPLSFRVTFSPSFYFPFFSYLTFLVSFSLPSIYERYIYFPPFSVSYATSYISVLINTIRVIFLSTNSYS